MNSAQPAEVSGPLGIHTDTVGHSYKKATLRQDLHTAAKELLPNEKRLQACLTVRQNAGATVGLEYDAQNGKARVTNVCRCGNPHICPNCGPIESELKNQELREDLAAWELAGNTVIFATFTLQHFKPEDLADTDDRLKTAFKRMWDRRDGRKFKDKWQVFGRRKSPDVTYTRENGWHPHYHVLLFLERRELSLVEVGQIEQELARLWQVSCQAAGGFADLDHGVIVKADHIFDVADYITSKTSGVVSDYAAEMHQNRADDRLNGDIWSITEEVTKSHLKEAKKGGVNPNELLLAYLWGNDEAGRLWRDYAEVFKGKKFLDTTPGLRARLDDLKTQYADDLDELRAVGELDKLPEWMALAHLGPDAFKQVVKLQILQWLFLEIKESKGDVAHLREFLTDFGITQVWYPTLQPKMPDWMIAGPDPPSVVAEQIRELNEFIEDWNK